MDSIRFIHCADIHLGAELSSLGALGASRREELMMTFEKVIALCRQEKPDFLFLPGDLFDTDSPEPSLAERVKALLASVPETEILIAPGNHDHLSGRSPYFGEWSRNVHIFRSGITSFSFPEKDTVVFGAGFTGSYETESLLGRALAEGQEHPEKIRIGVFHGDLAGSGTYGPISEAELRASGLHYAALGHIHLPSPEVLKAGKTRYAYSGSLEALGFDETGPRGIFAGVITASGKVDAEFVPVCRRMYLVPAIDLSGCSTILQAEEKILQKLLEQYGERYASHAYKLRLRGDCRFAADDLKALQRRLDEKLYFCKLRDETAPEENWEALAQETSLKGMFVKEMMKRLKASKTQEELNRNRQALRFGLKALEGEVETHAD